MFLRFEGRSLSLSDFPDIKSRTAVSFQVFSQQNVGGSGTKWSYTNEAKQVCLLNFEASWPSFAKEAASAVKVSQRGPGLWGQLLGLGGR